MLKLRKVLFSTRAAVDLASVMVGVIIIGIIGGIVAATIFAIIPWAQDQQAKANLDAVKQAQNVYAGLAATGDLSVKPAFANPLLNIITIRNIAAGAATLPKNAQYASYGDLLNNKLVGYTDDVNMGKGTDGACYAVTAYSHSGKVFWLDSASQRINLYTTDSESSCSGVTLKSILPKNYVAPTPVANPSPTQTSSPPTPTTPPATTTPTPTPTGPTYTLVSKYDFETSATTPKIQNGQTFGTVNVITAPGTGHGKSLAVSGTSGTVSKSATITIVGLTKGQQYRFSTYVYLQDGSGIDYGVGGSYASSKGIEETGRITAKGTWVKRSVLFTASATSADLTTFGYYNSGSALNYYVDDIAIEAVTQ